MDKRFLAQAQTKEKQVTRVWIFLLIMVNVITVENNDCILWNVHLIVHKVLSSVAIQNGVCTRST